MRSSRGSPLAGLLITAVAVTAVLGWLASTLFDLQRASEARQAHERLENSADALAGDIRGFLAETGDQLSASLSTPDSPLPAVRSGAVFAFRKGGVRVNPANALPFIPRLPEHVHLLEPTHARLRAAHALEFQAGDMGAAPDVYRQLTVDEDPAVRAAALLGLGRVLRKSHDVQGALDAYRRLEAMGQVAVDGYPAELEALDGQRQTFLESNRLDDGRRVSERIVTGIDEGRWQITRGTASELRDLVRTPRPESWTLAEVLAELWGQWKDAPPERGLSVASIDGKPVLLIWRARDNDVAAVVGLAEQLLPSPNVAGIALELTDADGTPIAGANAPPSSATRVTGDATSPWTLKVWQSGAHEESVSWVSASTLSVGVATSVVVFLWSTVYFSARAMRREARLTRLQSDFVSAVSHEFRSPLTTMRQLAELLEMNEVPNEERRQTYYEVLGREARRLQRLVETLLNFGRMEAGAERYRLEPVSVPHLIREVAGEVEAQHRHTGKRVKISGPQIDIKVLGDADALSLTIRNLLDNAIKYSPGTESVSVEWAVDGDRVSILVADQGLGIEPSERDAIFGRFVRGRAAAAANVKGTGVGLAMVRHVLTAHGGHIFVESQVGRGSTFTVLLPVAH